MRTATIFAAATALFSSALAAPAPVAEPAGPCRPGGPGLANCNGLDRPPIGKGGKTCMSDEDADVVANTFRDLIRGYTKEQALAALTEDFVDYSSAVSIVINKGAAGPKDVTAPIFTSRAQFMEGHGKQQPIPFEILDTWHNCNGTVSMRWVTTRSGQGQATEAAAIPVIGSVVIETIPAEADNPGGYKYRIHTLYSEFNSAAWLVNLGVFKPNGTVTPVPAGKRDVQVREASAEPMQWWEVGMI
ncbi:hypothetical protein K431DRAFT_312170 [Polychaeton citri CBS 116435]|uniref:NTF2-like domain-containing protein n=1 Tax=Polychaeton citri CBS 116435 TaxID=1314669 RepID=A0A9P4UPN9_9PEZI|nr:hypothetical protein K431DRAFT_312170 [Polychaeton citri CBS 116435]